MCAKLQAEHGCGRDVCLPSLNEFSVLRRSKATHQGPAAELRRSRMCDMKRKRREVLMDQLDALESESIYILREAHKRLDRIALLWSFGKDSNVLVWLAKKAFIGHTPLPVLNIDTGNKMPEVY